MSEFAGHTPGPWEWREDHVDEDGSTVRSLAPGVLILDVCGGGPWGDTHDRANAALIAAAPTLLTQRDALAEALREIRALGAYTREEFVLMGPALLMQLLELTVQHAGAALALLEEGK